MSPNPPSWPRLAKMQYYLTVIPMTNKELDTILLFPSIWDIRATLILEMAHYLLNTDNPLGRIARSRVVDLRDKFLNYIFILLSPTFK